MFARTNGVLALTPTADHSGKEGFAVNASSGNAALVSAATDIPLGVILEGATTSKKDAVALCDGALAGTVKVKLDGTPGTVALGTYLVITATGTFKADPGTGARVRAARALESGAANELIEAVLVKPESLS
jgi:hypothetical protein